MACTASSDCSKVTVPIPRLLPSLSSLTSDRFTTPAMLNTSFNFFQPTLKSSCKNMKINNLFVISIKATSMFIARSSHWPQTPWCPVDRPAVREGPQGGCWGCWQWSVGCLSHHNPCPAHDHPVVHLLCAAAHVGHVLHQDP